MTTSRAVRHGDGSVLPLPFFLTVAGAVPVALPVVKPALVVPLRAPPSVSPPLPPAAFHSPDAAPTTATLIAVAPAGTVTGRLPEYVCVVVGQPPADARGTTEPAAITEINQAKPRATLRLLTPRADHDDRTSERSGGLSGHPPSRPTMPPNDRLRSLGDEDDRY